MHAAEVVGTDLCTLPKRADAHVYIDASALRWRLIACIMFAWMCIVDKASADMEKALRIVENGLLLTGVGVVCFGLCLAGFSLLAPTQPPPSLNEGHGLAWAIGLMVTLAGLVPFTIGLAIRSRRKTGGRQVAAEPAVAAAERFHGPRELR